MRVYDLQRRLVSRVNDSLNLAAQNPNGAFTLLRNFKGFVKHVMVFNAQLSLPIDLAIAKASPLLMYYQFDQQYVNASNSLMSSNPWGSGSVGPSLQLNGNVTFQSVEWDQTFTFSQPSMIGTLDQNFSLYDGLGC